MRRSEHASLPAAARSWVRLLLAFATAACGAPAFAQPVAAPAAAVAPAVQPAPLPLGFQPPKPVPDVFKLRKPTMTDEEMAKARDTLARKQIDRKIREGQLSAEVKQLIGLWAKLRFAEMAAAEDRRALAPITRGMTTDLKNAALLQSNENRAREFRGFLAGELTREGAAVLDNNFYVRLQAIILLSRLNLREESPVGAKQPEVSYAPAIESLLAVLKDPQQHEGLKSAAARGIARLARDAEDFQAELRFEAGKILTDELARTDTHYWYQMRLAEALGRINLDYDRARKPIVVDALSTVIADEKRAFLVRAMAAKALGRTPLPAETNRKALADRLIQLGQQMSNAYNAAPSRPQWKEDFANLYLAFRPGEDDNASRLAPASIVKQSATTGPFEEARGRILPLAKHVLAQPSNTTAQPIPTELLKSLNEYLANNKP